MQNVVRPKSPLLRGVSGSVVCFLTLAAVVLLLSARGITNESTVALNGDMPRYLMNGAYFYDVIKHLPLSNLVEYTYRYYARYPALSLGHHPLLLGVAEAPFYFLFGLSVFSARLAVLSFMLIGAVAWFQLVRSLYGTRLALLSASLLVTTPYIVELSRQVLSETPALAMVIAATYCFWRYCNSGRARDAYTFAIVAVLSVYAKHLAIFMFPVFFLHLALVRGPAKLLDRHVLLSVAIMAVLLSPLIPLTLSFSRLNVNWVAGQVGLNAGGLLYYISALYREFLTLPVLLLSVLGIGVSIVRRDRRALLFGLWIVGFYLQITYTGTQVARYAVYWIPPFCLFAVLPLLVSDRRWWRVGMSAVLILITTYQFVVSFRLEPEYADGYEAAARYVVQHRKGASVLYGAAADTGAFTFFVRKHDPNQSLVVLLTDKMLVTSWMRVIVEERIKTPAEIDALLREFGVGYVVLADAEITAPPLQWLKQRVQSDAFILRARIPIPSNSHSLHDGALSIYEYQGYTPPVPGSVLRIHVPAMGRTVSVPFDELCDHTNDGRDPQP